MGETMMGERKSSSLQTLSSIGEGAPNSNADAVLPATPTFLVTNGSPDFWRYVYPGSPDYAAVRARFYASRPERQDADDDATEAVAL